MAEKTILKLKDISKRFGGVQALNGVSFEVDRGEVHAILGENGAGKSTMMKILAGVHPQDSGEIYLNDELVEIKTPTDAQELGIEIVFQELNLFPQLSIAANIFINREPRHLGMLDESFMEKETTKYLKMMEVDFDPKKIVGKLAPGERQMVEIARALGHNAKILILDEPNSALNQKETEELFEIIRHLKKQGVTILYISHRLEEVFEIADRITVLRDGGFEGTWSVKETSMEMIVTKMIGRKLEETFPNWEPVGREAPITLQVKNLSKLNQLESLDFDLHKGEVLGFAGLQGCGIENIFQILFGLEKATTGEIIYGGITRLSEKPSEAIKRGWGMIPAERRTQGLIMNWPIKTNISIVVIDSLLGMFGLVNNKKEKDLVDSSVEKYRISTDNINKSVMDLSGGNQQKVVIAKWLSSKPNVLIMNDPTRGIDVGAKAEIYKLIRELASQGIAILFTSSEIEEVIGLSDRIIVLYKGRKVKEFACHEADKERVMGYVAGSAFIEKK